MKTCIFGALSAIVVIAFICCGNQRDTSRHDRKFMLKGDTVSFYYSGIEEIHGDYIIYNDVDCGYNHTVIKASTELLDKLEAAYDDDRWLAIGIYYDYDGWPHLIEVDDSFYK